jgi:hypothetical protein
MGKGMMLLATAAPAFVFGGDRGGSDHGSGGGQ